MPEGIGIVPLPPTEKPPATGVSTWCRAARSSALARSSSPRYLRICASDAAASSYYHLDSTTLAATLIGPATGGTATGDLAAPATQRIAGTVFEDYDYGGGAGRSLLASGGSARSGARVELYDSAGAVATKVVGKEVENAV